MPLRTIKLPAAIAAGDASRQAGLAARLAELYPRPAALVLEIGCGHGHFLAAYASENVDKQCLGIDHSTKRVDRAQRKQRRLALRNLAFLKADAAETLAALPAHVRLAAIFVLFPDPWPKQRHHRRRLVQTDLLDALAARAEPGALFALRTDHAEFFAWARAQIEKHPAWRLDPAAPWPFEHSTVFQEMQGAHQSLVATRR